MSSVHTSPSHNEKVAKISSTQTHWNNRLLLPALLFHIDGLPHVVFGVLNAIYANAFASSFADWLRIDVAPVKIFFSFFSAYGATIWGGLQYTGHKQRKQQDRRRQQAQRIDGDEPNKKQKEEEKISTNEQEQTVTQSQGSDNNNFSLPKAFISTLPSTTVPRWLTTLALTFNVTFLVTIVGSWRWWSVTRSDFKLGPGPAAHAFLLGVGSIVTGTMAWAAKKHHE